MRQKIVAANWKMNGSRSMASLLLDQLVDDLKEETGTVIVFPPSLYTEFAAERLLGSRIQLGVQNLYPEVSGAYTGEISAAMAKDAGCHFALVGHSERRAIFGESAEFVAKKFHSAKESGIIPVLCVGEALEQREKGLTEKVVLQQLQPLLQPEMLNDSIIAYEPVWAIGTGKTATPEQAQQVHAFIRKVVGELDAELANKLPILYGGSVNETNAAALFSMSDIDGGLVGGASLDAQKFVEIVKCIK